jgi:anti-anti-sigma factor
MEPKTEVRLKKQGSAVIFDIRGDVTVASEPPLKEAYQSANHQGAEGIVLKFSKNAYINSGGIAVLIQLLAETRGNNQKVAIAGLSEHFKKIFGMVGITRFARICDTVEEALEQLSA